jgi:adenylate cyclase
MSTEEFKRRLTAILSADVEGYSRLMREDEEAISACMKVLHREPNNLSTRLALASTYSYSGREAEARAEAAQVLRIDPKWSVEFFAKTRPHKNQANTERFINALRKAGLK